MAIDLVHGLSLRLNFKDTGGEDPGLLSRFAHRGVPCGIAIQPTRKGVSSSQIDSGHTSPKMRCYPMEHCHGASFARSGRERLPALKIIVRIVGDIHQRAAVVGIAGLRSSTPCSSTTRQMGRLRDGGRRSVVSMRSGSWGTPSHAQARPITQSGIWNALFKMTSCSCGAVQPLSIRILQPLE